jgi:hypothetical protein
MIDLRKATIFAKPVFISSGLSSLKAKYIANARPICFYFCAGFRICLWGAIGWFIGN